MKADDPCASSPFVRLHHSYHEVGSDICGRSHFGWQLQRVQSDDVSLLHIGEVDDDISGHLLPADTLNKSVQSDKETTSLDVLVLVLVDESISHRTQMKLMNLHYIAHR